MEIVQREEGPFYNEYFKGNYDIQAYGIGDGKLDPSTGFGQSSPTRLANNRAKIETQPFFEEYKKLMNDGVSSIDPKVRKPIYDKLQEMIADESFIIDLAFWTSFMGLSKRVQGFKFSIDQFPYYGNVWLSS
jgi:ABC-type transport system substrate-binding protein